MMCVREPAELQSLDALKTSLGAPDTIRLLHVSAEPISYLGGVGLIIQRLVKGMPAAYEVDLACSDAKRATLPEGLNQRIGELITVPGGKWSIADKQKLLRQVREGDYDLIHFHGGTLSFDAHLPWRSPLHALGALNIPWVYSNHCAPALRTGLFPEGYPLPLRMLKTALAYSSLARLAAVCPRQIFDSRENQERIAGYFPWAKEKLMTIYHSGLEGEPPKPLIREPALTIGNLGHIAWRKGQFELVQAFSILARKFPQVTLLLVGPDADPDCAARIRAEIAAQNLQDRVSMPGGRKDLRDFWDKVDIYVQPSHHEGAPMALMEAAWHGKPAVGTRVSGIPEIIADGVNGLLVEPRNPTALAGAIERLVRDSVLRRRFAEAAPAHILAQGMTRGQMVKRHLDLYSELLACRKNPASKHASH